MRIKMENPRPRRKYYIGEVMVKKDSPDVEYTISAVGYNDGKWLYYMLGRSVSAKPASSGLWLDESVLDDMQVVGKN